MIQAITETNLKTYLQTKDNRIHASATDSNIRHLFKFTNDMDSSVEYSYPYTQTIYDRYTLSSFLYNANPDMYTGKINLLPSGYWKYEVYEIYWATPPSEWVLTDRIAPATEEFVFNPSAATLGIVQGLVTKGKMYVDEKDGTEEVTYSQNGKQVQTITIVDGGTGYATAPTITISGGGSPITTATATCTISGGVVNTVTIINAGNGYTENPLVTLSGGGATTTAQLIANINETNYIYTG